MIDGGCFYWCWWKIDLSATSGGIRRSAPTSTNSQFTSFPLLSRYRTNMYDNFDMPKCTIASETIDDNDDNSDTQTAEVQFIAEMVLRESGETTSFMETSQFEKFKTGGWLYKNGTIEAAPGSETVGDEGESENLESEDDGSMEVKLASVL